MVDPLYRRLEVRPERAQARAPLLPRQTVRLAEFVEHRAERCQELLKTTERLAPKYAHTPFQRRKLGGNGRGALAADDVEPGPPFSATATLRRFPQRQPSGPLIDVLLIVQSAWFVAAAVALLMRSSRSALAAS